ncbi:RHS repeat-associated core domain-containing protein [Pseudomonas mosselii]|uniref:RHS repeat-associated core domain-containing protein n=1 Tax=Pseudomonas mosselii TaxID=78327 RepID=UPI000BB4C70B|nr:RHS repeat-associated core domain-containing protein [Pseudomonas mosselii]ATB63363.1 hypothetical protein CLJ08_01450 [Pseudomonas mosselii]MDH1103746.1 RHS repeat-associated core domain-containing protein [Pseudomonas mosselii]UVN46504.1 RHS repeat-associated core domain-containing protein [Pseudomonas mosselii]
MSHPNSLPFTSLLVTDIAGSVLKRLNDQQPDVFVYCAFGHRGSVRAVAPLLGFNSQHREPSTGVYLLGNGYRSFNPVLMRFVSADDMSPFGDGGINAYSYCHNDPINRADSSGMSSTMNLYTAALVTTAVTKFRGLIHQPFPANGTNGNASLRTTSMPPHILPTVAVSPRHHTGTKPAAQRSVAVISSPLHSRPANDLVSPQPGWTNAPTDGLLIPVQHSTQTRRPMATVRPVQAQTFANVAYSPEADTAQNRYSRSRSSSIESTDSWDEWIPDQEALDAHRLESIAWQNGRMRTSI